VLAGHRSIFFFVFSSHPSPANEYGSRHPSTHPAMDIVLLRQCIGEKFPGYVVELPRTASSAVLGGGFRAWQLPPVDLSSRGTLYPIGAGDTVSGATLAAMQYLRRCRGGVGVGGGDGDRRVVLSDEVGRLISEKKAIWSDGETSSGGDDAGCGMATAFAFGLACGSASCLKEENSVFDVEDAMSFFGGMTKPVVRSIAAMDSVGKK
jgi:hypothetical protein